MIVLLAKFLANGSALVLTTVLVPGLHLSRLSTVFWVAVVYGIVNTSIGPAMSFLTTPDKLLAVGLLTLSANIIMLAILAIRVRSFTVRSLASAFLGAVILSSISLALNYL